MLRPPLRPSVTLVGLALASLLVVGCKQDIGERCEQDSDCNSGLCTLTGASAMGGICTTGVVLIDAAAPPDTAVATDARDGAADAADARAEAGGETSPEDGGQESRPEAGAETGGAELDAPVDRAGEVGASAADGATPTSDGASDLATEAGAGG
jgi:hypothetical protein